MSGEDERERGERPKRSWAEIDRLRDRPRTRRDDPAPRGAAATARARAAAKQYRAELDRKLFAKGAPGGATGVRLAAAVRAAQGTAALADACRSYLEAIGPPAEPTLLAAFLDTGRRELQRSALVALAEGIAARRLTLSPGLRAQVRALVEDSDDEIAEAAEAVLR